MGMYVFYGFYHKDCNNENVIPYLKHQDYTYIKSDINLAPEKRNYPIFIKLNKLFSKNGVYLESDSCYVFDKEALEKFKVQINDPEYDYTPEKLKSFVNKGGYFIDNDPDDILIVWITEDRMR